MMHQGCWVSLVAQMVKTLLAMQETWFDPWVGKIPGEGNGYPHSSILAWNIPWTEEPGGCSPWGHKESDMTE